MKRTKNKYVACLTLALTIFIASPLDDIIFTSLLGTALFGFGTIEFYLFLAIITILSVSMFRKHSSHFHLNKRITK